MVCSSNYVPCAGVQRGSPLPKSALQAPRSPADTDSKGKFSRGSNKKKLKTRSKKNTFKWKSSIIHNYIYLNQLLYCILPSRNSCFSLKILSEKNRVLKHECAVICHVPRHDSPNEGTASYRYLHALSSLLPGGSDDVGRNVPKHCLRTWRRHPRSSVGVQDAYNTRHPLPKLQDRKLVPVSCLAGSSREYQKMIS